MHSDHAFLHVPECTTVSIKPEVCCALAGWLCLMGLHAKRLSIIELIMRHTREKRAQLSSPSYPQWILTELSNSEIEHLKQLDVPRAWPQDFMRIHGTLNSNELQSDLATWCWLNLLVCVSAGRGKKYGFVVAIQIYQRREAGSWHGAEGFISTLLSARCHRNRTEMRWTILLWSKIRALGRNLRGAA